MIDIFGLEAKEKRLLIKKRLSLDKLNRVSAINNFGFFGINSFGFCIKNQHQFEPSGARLAKIIK